jgi:hypothetical protein
VLHLSSATPDLVLFDTARTPGTGLVTAQQTGDLDAARRHPVLCRRCAHVITDASLRVVVDGRATHARVNPAGVLFIFDCYRDAPGCHVHGAPTLEASWFTACAWRFAHCAHCATHLGWAFSGASSFFGLISERVVTE